MALTWVKIANLKGPKGDSGPQGAAGNVSAWKASTAYAAGQTVVSPGGDLVTAKVAFTSGSSYSAANWNASSQDGRLATTEARLDGRTLTAGQDFHTVTENGEHKMLSTPTNWATQNMPVGTRGILRVMTFGSNRVLMYTTYETTPHVYIQSFVSGVWGAWIDLQGAALDYRDGITLDPAQDIHALTTGGHYKFVASPTNWSAQNLPANVRGSLIITPFATNRVLTYTTYETNPRVFVQSLQGSGWSVWRELSPASLDTRVTSLETTASAAPPSSGYKVVPLQLTLGSSAQTDGALTGTARYVMKYAAPIFRVRVNIQNVHPSSGTVKTGAVDFTGLWFGKHAGSGAFTAAPTQVQGAFSTPADGSKWQSKWFYLNQTPGTEDLLSFGYTASNGTVFQCGGNGYTSTDPANAGLTTAPGIALNSGMPFYVWLEAETYSTTPHIAVFGDSLSSGVSAGGVRYSTLSQYCELKGALPTHYSNSGDTMQSWAGDFNSYKWKVFDGLAKPDALIWAMGSNDAFADTITLADMQGYFNTLYPQFKSKLTANIYLANITPRTSYTGANETKRRDYNTWLATLPNGARDLFNFRDAVSDDDETLKAAYDADGTHMNASGYAAEAAAITRPVTTPPVQYQPV